jgi:hypothetical protein
MTHKWMDRQRTSAMQRFTNTACPRAPLSVPTTLTPKKRHKKLCMASCESTVLHDALEFACGIVYELDFEITSGIAEWL